MNLDIQARLAFDTSRLHEYPDDPQVKSTTPTNQHIVGSLSNNNLQSISQPEQTHAQSPDDLEQGEGESRGFKRRWIASPAQPQISATSYSRPLTEIPELNEPASIDPQFSGQAGPYQPRRRLDTMGGDGPRFDGGKPSQLIPQDALFRNAGGSLVLPAMGQTFSQREPWETLATLLCAIRDVTFSSCLADEHRSLLLSAFKALQIQEALFRPAFRGFNSEWVPTRRERDVIVLACHNRYSVDNIEGAFYEYGGMYGLVALVVVFRGTDSIQREWTAIADVAVQQWLVSNVSRLFRSQRNPWVENWVESFIPRGPGPWMQCPLQYLGKHVQRRKANDNSRASQARHESREVVSWPYFPRHYRLGGDDNERTSHHQTPIPTSITSAPNLQHRDGYHNKRPNRADIGMPSPSSSISSSAPDPSQDPLLHNNHHNVQASSSHQRCISSPLSRTSSSRQDLYEQHQWSPTSTSVDPCPSRNEPPSSLPHSSNVIAAFEEIDQDVKDLATLMVFLGGDDIPKSMLLRATDPWRFFDRGGEPASAPAPDLGLVFSDTQSLESAVKHLESHAILQYDQDLDNYTIHSRLRLHVHNSTLSLVAQNMKYKASKLVFHTFPTDPDLITGDELYVALGTSQLPHLQHVLAYFSPGFVDQFSAFERLQVVGGCLSSSKFKGLDWKRSMLRTAEEIVDGSPCDPLLLAKVRLRRRKLSRLFPGRFEDCHTAAPDLHPVDESSNAHLGNVMLFEAQLKMDCNELSRASDILNWFHALNRTRPSTEERHVLQRITLFRVRIRRYQGDYRGSERLLMELYTTTALSKSILPGIISQLTSVRCELGETHAAMSLLQTQNFVSPAWLEIQGQARLLSLASAETHFMIGLKMLMKNEKAFDAAQSSFYAAKDIYRKLEKVYREIPSPSIVTVFRHFSVSAGLAMIAHLEARFGTAMLEDAYSYWQSASDIAEGLREICGWEPGFVQMIIAFSMSDITSRLGMPTKTANLIEEASELYARAGRQSYWFALALWFDLVADGLKRNGLVGLGWLSKQQYNGRQTGNGFR